MKKRILSLLLVMIMVFTLIPVYSMADTGKADTQGTDIKDIIGTIKDLIGNGGSGDISDIIGGLDKDQLIDVIKGLIGGDSNIGGILEGLDKDQLAAIIKGLISGGDIGDVIGGLDKDKLVEIIKGLIGGSGSGDIGDIIGGLDKDQLVEIIKGLISGGDIDIGDIIGGLDKDKLIEIIKGLIGDDSGIGDILGDLDTDKLVEIIRGLISGGDINIDDILGGLDKDKLIEIIKGLIGDDSNIGDILGDLDTDKLIEIIKGLINGGDIDIGDIIGGLDKDKLIEIIKGLIGGDGSLDDILGDLDIDKLIEIIKGLIDGDLDFGSLIKDLDPSLILKLISALFGSDLDIEGPSNVTVTEGQDASFSVKVKLSLADQLKGIEYSYIWIEPSSLKDIDLGSGKVDMVAIIKAIGSKALSTEDTLVIENASMNDSGRQFVCIVYNLTEKALGVSDIATLTVTADTGCTHSDMTFHAAVPATCTTDGSVAYYECSNCHNLYLDAERTVQTNAKDVIVPASGHTKVIDTPAVKETCTEPGCTEGSHCGTCNEILSVSTVIPAAGHKFEGGIQCTVCGEYVPFPFVDVPEDMWCRSEVDYVWKHGLMQGVTTTTFEPNSGMTRAQFVTVLYRMAGCPDITGLTEPFVDVDENYWAYNAIVWAYNKGVIKGYTATTFQPKDVITRAQVVTMLYRNEGEPDGTAPLNFVDNASIAEPYREAVAWAVKNNIVQGYEDGTFRPNMTATRAHMAVLIARFCETYKAF